MKDTLLIGITGSIAAWKICDLIRNLQKNPDFLLPLQFDKMHRDSEPETGTFMRPRIQVNKTEKAAEFVGPLTFATLTGNQVFTGRIEDSMHHIELKNRAALYLIAPATANILGKMAGGIADDTVSTSYLAAECPVIVAPAMNPNMYNHPAVQRNLKSLKDDGVQIIWSENGEVICGDTGTGKLADLKIIENYIIQVLKNITEKS